jgi:TRAP-type C4-dicarboxylate transport system substrate-binding protein
MTGHMHSVLAVFINEEVWQGLSEEDRTAITEVLDQKAEESLQWATDSEEELIAELKGRGMTFITEADGLDLATFREKVSAQVATDFPDFAPLIEQIEAVQ